MRLGGRAIERFHSKPEYIGMTADQLIEGLRGMFYHRPSKIALKRRFEERVWKRNETFRDYVHAKVIMANRIAVSDEMLKYIIDGISDSNLRDLARIQGFSTREEILKAFDEIALRDRSSPVAATNSRQGERNGDAKRKGKKNVKDDVSVKGERKNVSERKECDSVKRCFNCGLKDHISSVCPTKAQKCFKCNEYGHIAHDCSLKSGSSKMNSVSANACMINRSGRGKKQTKDVVRELVQPRKGRPAVKAVGKVDLQ